MQPALTLEQSKQILDVVLQAGIFEPPLPTEAPAIVKAAAEVIVQAETAKRAGVSSPAVIKVLDLASPLNNVPALDSIQDTESAAIPNGDIARFDDESPATNDPPFEPDNVSSEDTAASSTHATLLERDGEKESSHYLDPTSAIDIPALPRDFSKVGDLELRSLHAVRHAVLSKCIFELGLEESDYNSAQINYEQEYKGAQSIQEGNVTERREKAFLNGVVVDWRAKVDQHHRKVIMLRAYKELLESEIRGLSREFTMRTGERNTTP